MPLLSPAFADAIDAIISITPFFIDYFILTLLFSLSIHDIIDAIIRFAFAIITPLDFIITPLLRHYYALIIIAWYYISYILLLLILLLILIIIFADY